jgi:hypothetical protein
VGDADITVDTSFGTIVLKQGDDDLTPACSLIYEGIRRAMIARINKQSSIDRRIGFIDFDPK